jgi:hypothetical protein
VPCGAQTHIELAFDQGVGHRVGVAVDLDVDVGSDLRLAPFGELIGPGGQRAQDGTLDGLEVAEARALELLEGRVLRSSSAVAMAALSAASEKNCWWRRRARIQRSTTSTPLSALAFSLPRTTATGRGSKR